MKDSEFVDKLLTAAEEVFEDKERQFKSFKDEIVHELKREFKGFVENWEKVREKKRLPAILSREECQALITAFKKGKHRLSLRNNLVVRMLYATGMRIDELENLNFCDINYDANTVFIREGKNGKDRYVCIDDETLKLLKKWKGKKGYGDSIFGIGTRQLRRVVEKAGRLVGVSQKYDAMERVFSCHTLRHAFATHCYENGMRIMTLQRLLGHEYMGTTRIYVHTAKKYDLREYFRTHPLKVDENKEK